MRDNEERELAEIERHLAEESPQLARRFADFTRISLSALVTAGIGMLLLLVTGVVILGVGVRLASPVVIVCAALIAATVPAAIIWFVHRHGAPPYR